MYVSVYLQKYDFDLMHENWILISHHKNVFPIIFTSIHLSMHGVLWLLGDRSAFIDLLSCSCALTAASSLFQPAGGVTDLRSKPFWLKTLRVLLFVAETCLFWPIRFSSDHTAISGRRYFFILPVLPQWSSPRWSRISCAGSPAVWLQSRRQGRPCCCVKAGVSLVVGSRGSKELEHFRITFTARCQDAAGFTSSDPRALKDDRLLCALRHPQRPTPLWFNFSAEAHHSCPAGWMKGGWRRLDPDRNNTDPPLQDLV